MKVRLFSAIKNKISQPRKVLSYQERQEADILKYGAKKRSVPLDGITEEEINEIAPHRRLSAKRNKLSDPGWFVEQYEKEMGEEYLPVYWQCYTPNMKADYVVKQRYYSLLANKIMNKIQKEPIEHSYQFYDGEIVGHAIGNGTSVSYRNCHVDADVHNHPITADLDTCTNEKIANFTESLCPEIRKARVPHSGQDIVSSVADRNDSYVVDSNGGKFLFMPRKDIKSFPTRIAKARALKEAMEPAEKVFKKKSANKFLSEFREMNIATGYKEPMGNGFIHFDNVGHVIGYPQLGEYRRGLYKSGIIDDIGKYTELN